MAVGAFRSMGEDFPYQLCEEPRVFSLQNGWNFVNLVSAKISCESVKLGSLTGNNCEGWMHMLGLWQGGNLSQPPEGNPEFLARSYCTYEFIHLFASL